jgi:branched-chain amino acid transport system ATP-binding protein
MLLNISNLNIKIAGLHILKDIYIKLNEGEIVVIIGPNGAGKSTLLKSIAGIYKPNTGSIEFNGKQIHLMPAYKIVYEGISLIPEGRQLFGEMSVIENLEMGAYTYRRDKKRIKNNIEMVFDLFPILAINKNRLAQTFSGGEQQMISISRGLMCEPKLLMIDELSLGLAPKVINQLLETVKKLNSRGLSILMVEQNVRQALSIANRGYIFNNGSIVFSGTSEEFVNNKNIKTNYLGF